MKFPMLKLLPKKLLLLVTLLILPYFIFSQVVAQYSTPGNNMFTVPAGVTTITVEAWGAGGDGGQASGILKFCGGGGGGAYVRSVIGVIPGDVINLFVGDNGSDIANERDTWFSSKSVLLAKAGKSVGNSIETGGDGGSAAASIGDVKISGANGGDGSNPDGGMGGDSGNTTGTGGMGAQLTATIAQDGLSPGGGGGGGASDELNNNHYHLDNGLGSHGAIKITFSGGSIGPDVDNDGVEDTYDLDNDNDGILDEIECGLNETSITISPSGSNAISETDTAIGGYPVTASVNGNPGPSGVSVFPSSFNVFGTLGANDSVLGDTELSFTPTLFDDGLSLTIAGVKVLYFDLMHYVNVPEFQFDGMFDSNGGGGWTPFSGEGNPELLVSNGSLKLMIDTKSVDSNGNRIKVDALPYLDASAIGAEPFILDETFTFDIFVAGGVDFIVSNANFEGPSKFSGLIIKASISVCSDTDGDGISNVFDTDSDADGCADAMEGSYGVLSIHLNADDQIDGLVYSNGVPVLVGQDGQSDESSANAGVLGNCGSQKVIFDGTDDYIITDYNMSNFTEFTMMLWIKFVRPPAGSCWLMGQDNGFLSIDNAGKVTADVYSTANQYATVSTEGNIVQDSVWTHLTLVYNSNTGSELMDIYIDGKNESQTSNLQHIGPVFQTDSKFEIGGYSHVITNNPPSNYKGSMVEIRVYSKALTESEIRNQVYQQVENIDGLVYGKEVPKKIGSLSWSDLGLYLKLGETGSGEIQGDDSSDTGVSISYKNMDDNQETDAPIPFIINGSGAWMDDNIWEQQHYWNRDKTYEKIQDSDVYPYGWAIVRLEENVDITSGPWNIELMGLTIPESSSLTIDGSIDMNKGTGTGQSLTVSEYLVLDGGIDLEGESQFFQNEDVLNLIGENGYLERDQEGTLDKFTYNYWSAPVTTNGSSYNLGDIMPNVNFIGGYDGRIEGNGSVSLAEYWIWKFANKAAGQYSQWQHMKSSGSISAGEGFTMKGPDTGINNFQNYAFRGIPNNGEIILDITGGNDYLVGNPYPSALDADQFILDNKLVLEVLQGIDSNDTGGSLMFWEHWGGGSHYLKEYDGGYAYYTLSGGTPAVDVINGDDWNDTDPSGGTKTPGRYIPVGQGFFVRAYQDGQIIFNNNQRAFVTEWNAGESLFMKSSGTVSQPKEHYQGRMKIRLGATMPKGYHRQILITVDERTTSGMDYGFEARLVDDLNSDMFWVLDDNKFVIQGIPKINRNTEIPLGFSMKNAGTMKIGIDALENVPEDHSIFIKELATGITYEISESIDFELELEAGDYFDKYALVFQPQVKSLEELALIEGVKIRMNNDSKQLEIHRLVDTNMETIEVYNFLGQRVGFWSPDNQHRYLELHFDKSAGVYIVKVNTQNGQLSKKVLVD